MELTDEQKAEAMAELQAVQSAAKDFTDEYLKHISSQSGEPMSNEEREEVGFVIFSSFMAGSNYITKRIAARIIERMTKEIPVDPKEIN